jgi:beta-N-acetylhexosaminidase
VTELERLAAGCVFPGFPGHEPPDWLRRRLLEGLGGVVLFAWNVRDPEQLARLTAALRAERPEVVVATDEEGGDVTRLGAGSGSSYPGNLALGAVDDTGLTRRVAAAMGADLRAVGVDLDLAPVADVLGNVQSPIVGVRSFGTDPELVARHVAAFVTGLQEAGVAGCAKHFPGHGDVAEDSHVALPVLEAVTAEALLPFRAAIEAGVRAIMSAHIVVRAAGPDPATLNRSLLHDLLRAELGFEGMVMTDALEMKAISGELGPAEAAVRALEAGADAVCLGHDLGDDAVGDVIRSLAAHVPEERLAEAAARVAAVGVEGTPAEPDRAVGLEAARRALLVEGEPHGDGAQLVVELAPPPTIAAGEVPASLAARLPGAEGVVLREGSEPPRVNGRRLVVVVRNAHLHEWQRRLAEALLEQGPGVLVETGVPVWRPAGATAYVATYGAGRVNLDAAAERLIGPHTDEERLRGITVGEVAPLAGPIELADYDPSWPVLFAREEDRIRAALGDRALSVEHVGSTSVPGLAAKPIVDIVLVVPDSSDEPAYVPPLEAAGYTLRIREPDWFEHRVLKGPDTNVNVHVFSEGCDEVDRMLAFRDHLRSDPDDFALYLRAKRDLAGRDWQFVQNYADAKTAIVKQILARALPGD